MSSDSCRPRLPALIRSRPRGASKAKQRPPWRDDLRVVRLSVTAPARINPTKLRCVRKSTALTEQRPPGGTTSKSSDSRTPRCARKSTALTTKPPGGGEEAHRRWPEGRSERGASKAKQRPPWRDDLRVVRFSVTAPALAQIHGADNQAAGRWRGSASQMARRAQRAGREQGKAAPSMEGRPPCRPTLAGHACPPPSDKAALRAGIHGADGAAPSKQKNHVRFHSKKF